MAIHPTAIVDRRAELDPDVEVGAYAVIEGGVRIAAGTRISHHAYIATGTTIEADCRIHPFAVVGHAPQDLKYADTPSYTQIGAATIIREHASVHRGTEPESTTRIGRGVFMMSCSHVAHNCVVGDHAVLANSALVGGHAQIGERAFLGGNCSVHQFCRIGAYVMLRGNEGVASDIPPFCLYGIDGVASINIIGLKRGGFTNEEREEVRRIFRLLYRQRRAFSEAARAVIATARFRTGQIFAEFLSAPSKRGYSRYTRRGQAQFMTPVVP